MVPIICDNKVMAVLDVDSQMLNYFDEMDKKYLEEIISAIDFALVP